MNAGGRTKGIADEVTALDFFRSLYGATSPGFFVLWNKQDKRSHWFAANDVEAAARRAVELAAHNDCYFGFGLQGKELGASERGTSETVCAWPGLAFDVDVKSDAHAQEDLPLSVDEALEFVDSLPLAPTIIVETGHGLHLYWLFDHPWIFSNDDERKRAAQLSAGWQRFLLNLGRERGWKFDNTSDLARLFRIPGTLNHKGVEKSLEPSPRVVRLVGHRPGARYTRADFDGFADIAKGSDSANNV